MLLMLFSGLSVGTSIILPALQVAIKRFTNELTRPAAFSVFYVFMNLAAMMSGWTIDVLRAGLPRLEDGSLTGPVWDLGFVSFAFTY